MEESQKDDEGMSPLALLSLERHLMEVVHELNMKRRLLKESRKEYEDAVLKQHEVEHLLDQERLNLETTRLQLEVAVGAVQRCGEEKNAKQSELSRLRVEMEIAARERDILKQQCHSYKVEKMSLSRQVEELQSQLHCQQLYQEKCTEQEMRVTAALEKLKREAQALDQDKKRLERSVSMAGNIMKELKLSLHQSCRLLKRASNEQSRYEDQVFKLNAEIAGLKQENKAQFPRERKEWKTEDKDKTNQYLQELKEFLSDEHKGSSAVAEAFQKSLQTQMTLEKQEQEARNKLRLEEARLSSLVAANEELNKNLQESQHLVRKFEEQVKELKLAKKEVKNECRDVEIQTGDESDPYVTSSVEEDSKKLSETLKDKNCAEGVQSELTT